MELVCLIEDKQKSQEVPRLQKIADDAVLSVFPFQCQKCEKRTQCPEVWGNVENSCWHQLVKQS